MTDSRDTQADQLDAVAIGLETKQLEPDDPMEMKAAVISGDERLMMECLIEEFAHLGWGAKKISRIFSEPFFLASHGLEKRFGEQAVLECIEHTLARCGVFHFEMEEPSAGNRESPTKEKESSTERNKSTEAFQVIRIVES